MRMRSLRSSVSTALTAARVSSAIGCSLSQAFSCGSLRTILAGLSDSSKPERRCQDGHFLENTGLHTKQETARATFVAPAVFQVHLAMRFCLERGDYSLT